MIDCGEGTQYQLLKYKTPVAKLNRVFISHLHGDHYLGLMGIIYSLHLSGRTSELTIYGPRGLDEIITTQLKYSGSTINYPLTFVEVSAESKTLIYENEELTVHAFPLLHRIPCTGFLFAEKPKPRRIKGALIPKDFPIENFEKLKKGEDITDADGKVIFANKHLTLPPKHARSYAFCSDTGWFPTISEYFHSIDLIYHETTFLEEKEKWARQTFHSTTKDAGLIAKQVKAKQLLIGHFSARYKSIEPFVEETKQYFKNSMAAEEGKIFTIKD